MMHTIMNSWFHTPAFGQRLLTFGKNAHLLWQMFSFAEVVLH